jgi:hypothetical protein
MNWCCCCWCAPTNPSPSAVVLGWFRVGFDPPSLPGPLLGALPPLAMGRKQGRIRRKQAPVVLVGVLQRLVAAQAGHTCGGRFCDGRRRSGVWTVPNLTPGPPASRFLPRPGCACGLTSRVAGGLCVGHVCMCSCGCGVSSAPLWQRGGDGRAAGRPVPRGGERRRPAGRQQPGQRADQRVGQAQDQLAAGHGHGVVPQLQGRGREGEEAQPAHAAGGAGGVLRALQPVCPPCPGPGYGGSPGGSAWGRPLLLPPTFRVPSSAPLT